MCVLFLNVIHEETEKDNDFCQVIFSPENSIYKIIKQPAFFLGLYLICTFNSFFPI